MYQQSERSRAMIKCLPVEVQGKLRSGAALPSLQQCVEELVLNSIDAEATCVGVRMDMEAFKVQVIDNGTGLNAEDLQCVGTRYHTSKCSTVEDLENLQWYGFRGEALASIVSLATLVEISSRTRSSVETHVRIFQGGKPRDVFQARESRPSAGTTVVVCNFFHNMPVRRKRVDPVLEAERIRHRLEAVALMHPSVSFTLKNDCTGAMLVQLPKARDTYHRFLQIHGLSRAQSLREVSHAQGHFRVSGHIGREGHYNRSLQFLYVNGRLLLKTEIHKLLNVLLRRLCGNQRSDSFDGESAVRSPKSKRIQELHGVYVINIQCPYSEYDVCLEPAKTLIEFREWDGILMCVEEAVKAFLNRENLMSEVPPGELDSANPSDQIQEWEAGGGLAADHSTAVKLASHSVRRRSEEPSATERGMTAEDEDTAGRTIGGPVADPQSSPVRVEPVGGVHLQEKDTTLLLQQGSEVVRLGGVSSQQEGVTQQSDSCCLKQIAKELSHIEHRHVAATNRKISVSDPYVHECLQSRGPVRMSRPADHRVLQQKCEDRASNLKHQNGQDEDRTCQKRSAPDFRSMIPPKTLRVSAGPKISLSKQSGSLEKFRRIYGKWKKLESRLKEAMQGDDVKPLEADQCGGVSTVSCRLEDQQQCDGVDEKEAKERPQSQAVLLVPDPKPALASSGGEKSLASKLRLLKQRRLNRSLSQDSNNNRSLRCSVNSDLVVQQPTGAGQASCDWVHHYDSSVGKSSYVNKVTGLSRYGEPPAEETPVRCTSDLTNRAVDVVSEMGENL